MIAVVLLAGGASRRMGAHKLLLPLGGETLIRRAARTALAADVGPVWAVLGRDPDRLAAELADLSVQTVLNPDYAQGMSTSLRRGIAALPPEPGAALIMLADQPLVTPAILRALAARQRECPAAIVQPSYAGTRGNPVLFPRALFPELLAVSGDQGGREVVKRHADLIEVVPFESTVPLRDVDTAEEYEALRAELP